MKPIFKKINLFLLLSISFFSFSNKINLEPKVNDFDKNKKTLEFYFDDEPDPTGYNSSKYFHKPVGLPTKNFTGTTSEQLQALIDANTAGAIIKIPKKTYLWKEIKLKSKIQLEIEKGTIIKPFNNTVRRIFSVGTFGGGPRIQGVSIIGDGGNFIVNFSAVANLNKDISFIKLGRVSNFKISGITIKERRTSLASILLNYIPSDTDREPWPKHGVIEKINQIGISHTGYGLIQGYSASNVLFKNLNCKGGITLRFETDDKTMKDAVKGGGKVFGMRNIYADVIKCTSGISAVMLSPHFTQNGKINVRNVTSTGCAFALRVEHGFIEVFDKDKRFALTSSGGDNFQEFISNLITEIESAEKFVGERYKRNNGTQWAVRLSETSIKDGTLGGFIKNQIGELRNGRFANTTFKNVTAIHKPTDSKMKVSFLDYIPCEDWETKIKRPTDIEMPQSFEFYGPSMGLKFDNTDGTNINGNYRISIDGMTTTGFGGKVINVSHDTEVACPSLPYATIPTTTTPGL